MGKSRKNKPKSGQRADPIAKPVKPPTDPELVALRDAKILPVIKDLQSTEPKSRITAARAIANIIQDSKCRKLLLREQIVHRVLTETLTDQSLESKAAGWFILKVLVQEEEADFCVHLYRQDVLTAIEYAAENVASTIASGGTLLKLSKAEQQFVWDIAGCLVVLVAALAEASEEILKAMDNLVMVPNLLIALVSSPACPMDLLEDAMMSLLVLSEDNPTLADVIVNSESGLFGKLTELQATNRLVSVPACGILHNLFTVLGWQDGNIGENDRSDATLVPTLSQALDTEANSSTDIMELALEILASIATDIQKTMEGTSKSSIKNPKKLVEEWNGIEDVANEDEKMDEEGANDDSDAGSDAENGVDHEMDEDEMDADMDMVAGSDHDANGAAAEMDDLPTLQALLSDAVPRLIRLASAEPASDKDHRLQDHALAALNNLAWSVSCVDFSGGESAGLLRAWRPVARRIWDEVVARTLATDTADVELATKVTGLAWALARTLRGTVLHGDPQRKFMALYQATKNLDTKMSPAGAEKGEHDPLQSLGVKCIGVLGLLAQDPAPISVNREIGVFLIRTIAALPETPVADAVEAIDQIFDMYADEDAECDKEVFWKDNFLPHLEESVPKLRAAAKKIDKRTMFELRSRVDETLLNLQRLILYKHKHKPA